MYPVLPFHDIILGSFNLLALVLTVKILFIMISPNPYPINIRFIYPLLCCSLLNTVVFFKSSYL